MFKVIPLRSSEERTILDWYYDREQINLEPSYQRMGDIWDKDVKQYFLDSIINGFDVPKFYFHYFPNSNMLSEKELTYAIIDGKQRFKAIVDFMNGEIDLGDSIQYYKDTTVNLKKLTYADLALKHPVIKAEFDSFILDVVFIVTDEKDKIEELFARLNKGEPLNNAEKRNALGGYLVEEIRNIAQHKFFKSVVNFENKRYDYYDIIAKLLLLESAGKIVSLSKKNLDTLVINNRKKNEKIMEAIYKVKKILTFFCDIYEDSLFVKSSIPVNYWLIRTISETEMKSHQLIKDFLVEFNRIRLENRKREDAKKSIALVEFDKLTQQGTVSLRSLECRYEILKKYFDIFVDKQILYVDDRIDTDDLDLSY